MSSDPGHYQFKSIQLIEQKNRALFDRVCYNQSNQKKEKHLEEAAID